MIAILLAMMINGPQGRLNVDDGGRSRAVPVLFVHGNGANLTQWRAQLDHVRRTRRAVAFDLRGMGRSDLPKNGDYSVAAMMNDIDAVADKLRLRRFVIVGHSYGATVVAAYAASRPKRVAGVVFADAAGNIKISPEQEKAFFDKMREDKDRFVASWFAPILKPSNDEVRKAVLDSAHNVSFETMSGALHGILSIDMGEALRKYPGPRLAIAAADIESPSSLHVQFPDVPVKKIHGAGHWLMMDKPEEFNAALDDFLRTMNAER